MLLKQIRLIRGRYLQKYCFRGNKNAVSLFLCDEKIDSGDKLVEESIEENVPGDHPVRIRVDEFQWMYLRHAHF